jgi:hypothetical protein
MALVVHEAQTPERLGDRALPAVLRTSSRSVWLGSCQSTNSLRIRGAAIAAVDAQEQIPRERPSENLDERLCVDSCLTKHTCQCPHCQITAMEQMPAAEAT